MSKYLEEKDDDVAFERCVGLIANMMIKYGPKVLEKRKIQALKKYSDCETVPFPNDGARKNRLMQYAKLQHELLKTS